LDGEVCSTGYFVFRTKPFLDNRYLFYWLLTDKYLDSMEQLQTGASYPAVNDTQVRQQEVVYPKLPEQQRIVAILDEAFTGLATATANAEKNLKNARELFDGYLNSVFTIRGRRMD
jgi:type I restriction enzyme S subunit